MFMEKIGCQDSAVILAQIRGAIDCKDWKGLQKTIIAESFADLDSYWELVSMLGKCITLENSKTNTEFLAACKECLTYLISHGNAKELLLALLEQIDETTEDVKFKEFLLLLDTTLHKLSAKRLHSLELVLVSLSDHILHLSLSDDDSKVTEEVETEDEEKEQIKTISPQEIRISDLITAYLKFLNPFVNEVSITHRHAYKGDNLQGQITLLVKHLICIIGQPLINFDLSNCQSEKYSIFASRSCAQSIVQNITKLRPNIQSLLDDLVHCNSSLERKQEIRQASRQENPMKNYDSDENDAVDNEEEIIPVLALSNLSYLLHVEKFGMTSFPCVYSNTYLLQFNLPFVSCLLLHNNPYVIQKGVCLLQATVVKVLPGSLDHYDLEYPDWFIVLDALTQVLTGCASKIVRQACFRLLLPFMDLFTSKGRYKIFEKIFKTYCHSGVIGYVIQFFKNQIEKELKSSNPNDQFLGASMYKLLSEVASMPDGARTRLLDHSDQLIAVLNLVRYLLLCDPPSQNLTGIWSRYGELEQEFLNPLRQCLDVTKVTFNMELKDVQHGKTQKMSEVEFGISVGGQQLPEMTKEEKMKVLNLALRTFDIMESVLCRVFEIADQQRKAVKDIVVRTLEVPPALTSSAGILSTPADFPFFSTFTAASTLSLRIGWSTSVVVSVSRRVVRSLAGVRHLSQEAGKSGSAKETLEDTSEPPAQTAQADDKREETEYQTKQRILKAALPFVHTYGWTKNAIAKGAEAEGMPGVAHGLFLRGGVELVFYFYRDCNQKLAEQLSTRVKQQQEQKYSMPSISGFIKSTVEQRLRMNIPYMDKWQQAMAIQTLPQNAREALSNLAALVDDIWYYADDQSTDFNWYTKRASLAGVYKSTEIYMLQDNSEDFQNTWEFLDRRMRDLKNVGKFARSVQENSVIITEGLYGMCIMARNILGINARTR